MIKKGLNWKKKKMEFEADMYAMTQIVNDFEILAEIWEKY